MQISILHVTPYYLPEVSFGGPVFSVSAMCEALAARGYKVTVFTVGYQEKPKPRTELLNGVEVRYFKGEYGSPSQVSFQLWNALAAEGKNYQVVHLHTWWNVLIFRSLSILKRQGIPVILSPRGMMSDYSFSHRKTWLKKTYQRLLGINMLQGVSLHATSDAEASDMALRTRRSMDEVFVIPNLLNLQVEDSHRTSQVSEQYVIGFLSRLHHKKGIEILLEAVAQVPAISKLVIGGRGAEDYEELLRSQVQRLGIADRVEFVGWISDTDKPAFFKKFDLFVLPSFNENFANVVAEAWAAGKPVVVSSEVGLSDYVLKYELGWVCQPTTASLVKCLKNAWQERTDWQTMGANALDLVNERFSDTSIVEEYENMYKRVVQPGTKARHELPIGSASNNSDFYVLGINAHHADASAALLRNGEVVAAMEEERFRRVKHWAGFPTQSIIYCLAEAGIPLSRVDAVAVGRDPKAKWMKKARFMIQHLRAMGFALKGRLNNADDVERFSNRIIQFGKLHGDEKIQDRLHFVEHHRSHLASAFFASGFQEAAVVSVDGSGDFTTTMMAVGKDRTISVLNSIDFPHSLGIFYTAFTQLLGFPFYGDEYKVMGLAPYGEPTYLDKIRDVVKLKDNGLFELSLEFFAPPEKGYIRYDRQHRPVVPTIFSTKLEEKFFKARKPEEPLTQEHKNLAASVQRMLEETLFHILRYVQTSTGQQNLCLAGGVAQNSVANGKITRTTGFKNLYVPAAGHDAGLALGAAMYVHHQVKQQPRTPGMYHAYTGKGYEPVEISELLQRRKVHHTMVDSDAAVCSEAAACIANGGVVGWFQGRGEFGPRALGNRSILADPRRDDARQLLNDKIKRRESFRPFAPSVLKEYAGDYFEYYEEAPFMEKVFDIRPEMRSQIPAVTHVDGSGRLQTVCRENNPVYYMLIDTFRQLTGVPVLLNTSFNENEPIVNSPEEALLCFERTDMDMLVLGKFIITRKQTI